MDILTAEQIIVVGLVASALSVVLRLVAARFGWKLGKATMTIVVAVLSFVLAVVFNLPQFPVYVDPLAYVAEWVAIIGGYLGVATAIYNLILDKVLDKLDFTVEKFLT